MTGPPANSRELVEHLQRKRLPSAGLLRRTVGTAEIADHLEAQACGSSDFYLTGTLKNTASAAKDVAANVELGYLIDQGGEYVSSVELIPTGWSRIEAGHKDAGMVGTLTVSG